MLNFKFVTNICGVLNVCKCTKAITFTIIDGVYNILTIDNRNARNSSLVVLFQFTVCPVKSLYLDIYNHLTFVCRQAT